MKMSLGERVLSLCKEKGISQQKLAKKANLPVDTIWRIISNRTKPSKAILMSIAEALEVELKSLIEDEKELDYEVIGRRINKLCLERRMKREDLANKAGVSISTVSDIINGYKVKGSTLVKIAEALDIELRVLIRDGDEDELDYKVMGRRIRKLCLEKGMGQSDLANKAKLSNSTVFNAINGYKVKGSTLVKIAEALDIELRFLIKDGDEDELDYKVIGRRIRSLCLEKGMTQKDLANKANLSIGAIFRAIKGDGVRISTLMKITEVLEIELKSLIKGEYEERIK